MVVTEAGHGLGHQPLAGLGREALDEGRHLRHAHPPGHEVGGAEVGERDPHRGDVGLQAGLARRRLHPLGGRQPRDGIGLHRLVPGRRGPPEGAGGFLDGLLGRVGIVEGVGRRQDDAAGPRHPPGLPQAGGRIDEVVDREGRDHGVDRAGRSGSARASAATAGGRSAPMAASMPGATSAAIGVPPTARIATVAAPVPAPRSSTRQPRQRDRRSGHELGGQAGGRPARDRPATRHRCGSTPRRPTAAPPCQRVRSSGGRCSTSDRRVRLKV